MKELFHFLVSPTSNIDTINLKLSQSIKLAFSWYIKAMILAVIFNIPKALINLFDLGPTQLPIIEEPFNLLEVIIIMPIIEEIIFRLPLKFKPYYFIISISLFIYCIAPISFGMIKSLILPLSIGIILFIIINTNREYFKNRFQHIYQIKFQVIFYCYTLLFGGLHILNYTYSSYTQILISPLFILPQLILGVIFGYVRIKYNYGLIIAIIIHILCNLTSLTPYIIQFIKSI